MLSILFVKTSPPTIFIDIRKTVRRPRTDDVFSDDEHERSPPMTITLDIAFVIDIRGECKAGVTFITT
jgi:hypothetical protein